MPKISAKVGRTNRGTWRVDLAYEFKVNPNDVAAACQKLGKQGLNLKMTTQMFDVDNLEASELLYLNQLLFKVKPVSIWVAKGRTAITYQGRARPPQALSSDAIAKKHNRKKEARKKSKVRDPLDDYLEGMTAADVNKAQADVERIIRRRRRGLEG